VAQLSSGEKQRLALLRLMVNRPRVLLLDEPTANLDPENVTRVEKLVAAYLRREGAAVLWVSHDPEQTRRVAQRRLRLQAGRLKRDGAWTPAEDAQR
jgi:ABC-type iron transport system FetAB ATPase subunit